MRRKIVQLKKGDLPVCRFYEPYNQVLKAPSKYTKLGLNNGVYSYIDRMKQTASSYNLLYLTSNQVFSNDSIFVIKKDFKDHVWIHQSYANPHTYRGYINPQILQFSGQKVSIWQRCASMPYVESKVERNTQIQIQYVDQKRQKVKEQLFGFKSYVYQHCIDHLKGKCPLDWNICNGNIRVYPEIEQIFPKTKFVLKDYTMRIKQALSKRILQNQNQQLVLSQQQKAMQNRHEQALRKSMAEQIHICSQKYGGK